MLSAEQFQGRVIQGPEGPIRDLTSARISTRTNRPRARADEYRSARHAYNLKMEEHAIGYKTEEREYRENNPPPTWKGFLQEGFH